jgi:hypothetical protein
MRTETVSKRDVEMALPPKKPPAPSIERGPRQAVPASRVFQNVCFCPADSTGQRNTF